MTDWYVDPINGTDSVATIGSGDSFETRRKKYSNIGSSLAFAPGHRIKYIKSPDPVSLGVNGTWTNGPYGSTQNITSSTNATPIVITKVAHGLVTGDTVIVASHTTNTNANGVWEINKLTDDTFELINADGTNSVGNGVGGASGTFRKINNLRVMLASEVTKNIACIGNRGALTNWTASANVTCSLNTSPVEGGERQSIAIAGAFTTGKAAYLTLPSTLDLSTYTQVSLNLYSDVALTAGNLTLTLCSDTTGDTAVDTLDIPVHPGIYSIPITIDKGSALGASINSIALNVAVDFGAVTVYLDDIIACKAPSTTGSVSLTSVLGKNSGNDPFYGIQSINSKRVMLCGRNGDRPNATPFIGYFGTTETVTAYARDTIIVDSTMGISSISGTSGNPITISGGWDATSMSTQTGETWLNYLVEGSVKGFDISSSQAYVDIEKIAFYGFYRGVYIATSSNEGVFNLDIPACGNCTRCIEFSGGGGIAIKGTVSNLVGGTYGFITYGLSHSDVSIGNIVSQNTKCLELNWLNNTRIKAISGSRIAGVQNTISSWNNVTFQGYTFNYTSSNQLLCDSYDFQTHPGFFYNSKIINCTFDNSVSTNLTVGVKTIGRINFVDCTLNAATEYSFNTTTWGMELGLCFKNKDTTANNHILAYASGYIQPETLYRYTTSGLAWKLAPTSSVKTNSNPLRLSLGKHILYNGIAKVFTIKARRTSTNVSGKFIYYGEQLPGIANDISDSISVSGNKTPTSITRGGSTATVNLTGHGYLTGDIIQITGADQAEYNVVTSITKIDNDTFTYTVSGVPATPATGTITVGQWETLSISLTSTEDGVIELFMEVYGGTTDAVYIDNLDIT